MTGNALNSDNNWIVASATAGVATGMYLCSLGFALRWLLFDDLGSKLRKNIHWFLLFTSLTLCALSGTHFIIAIIATVSLIQGNILGLPSSQKLPWTSVVMCTITDVAVLVVDAFLIYRCWVVCFKNWKYILCPVVFWLGGFTCTVLQAYWQIVKNREMDVWSPVNMTIGPGIILTPFWACTIILNLYATATIIYRIWKVDGDREGMGGPSRELRSIIRVFVESGSLYLLVTVPHFIVWFTNSGPTSAAVLILGWINLPVVCSAFNLIIIRTSQNRVQNMEMQRQQSEIVFAEPKLHQFSSVVDDHMPHNHSGTMSTLCAV